MKRRLTALVCALFLPLAACGGEEETPPEGAYQVYYAAAQGSGESVAWEYRVPEEPAAAALAELVFSPPETYGLSCPVGEGVQVRSAELESGGLLRLDLSEQYGGLSGTELTVANACLTLTLCQLEGVEAVAITVEGEPIPYQSIQVLRPSDFLLSTPGEEDGGA